MCVRASRRWRSQEEEEEERKNPRMTKESLRRICKEQKLYITPHLNDVLYLHYKGYSKIENLEEYTGLKCLWLENNGIDKIENLDNQKDLRNLYLHNNLIKHIENLEGFCPLLDSLNLCHNSVSKIQNLSKLEHLHTLHISHNRLQDFADVEHLKECKELSCVDLQHNWLDDPNIVDIFEEMPSLRVLYLTGNPVVKKIPFYRKNLTVRCKKLTYLDDRPVFPKDRAAAEAWSEGGLEAEKACRQKWADDERAKIDASVKGLLALRDKAKAAKFKEEMQKLELKAELEEDEEEEEEERSEEADNEAGPSTDNLQEGDSEEISHNGIIFPWNLDEDSRSRNRNELGEGGRSLIVELPDPEPKPMNSVSRRTLKDPEIKNKLHEALLSAEWLQEKNSNAVKENDAVVTEKEAETNKETEFVEQKAAETESEEQNRTEIHTEMIPEITTEMITEISAEEKENEIIKEKEFRMDAEKEIDHASSESSDVPAETIAASKIVEEILQDEEEIEKGTLDNLIKEKELAYGKYLKKTKEEILPNISHFTYGQDSVKQKEKSLGQEIEELLRAEKEEMEKEKEEDKEEIKKRLMEAGEHTLRGQPENKSSNEVPKNLVLTEIDNIIKRAVNILDEATQINEREANEILDNGVKLVDQLNSIGKLPLDAKVGSKAEEYSSDDEFHDVEEPSLSSPIPVSAVKGAGRNKLELQESEEYYSLMTEDEEESQREERDPEPKTVSETYAEENVLSWEQKTTENESEPKLWKEREALEESNIKTYERNITSSIELQIVTENDEKPEGTDD